MQADERSGKIVVLSHCLLNVHSLERGLSEYRGCEEELIKMLVEEGVGIFQLPCPEMVISHISRLPLPKDSYDVPEIRRKYREIAENVASTLSQFVEEGYRVVGVIGAEASPTWGIEVVGRWKDPEKRGKFPDDVEFVQGMGVFMEEFKDELEKRGIRTNWVGLPGKTLKSLDPERFDKVKVIERIRELIKS